MKRFLIALAILLASLLCLDCFADTYVIAVGINRYKSAPSLMVSEKDATDFARLIKGFPKTHVTTITGRYATRSNLVKVISREFSKAGKDDAVILYFSGHGNSGGVVAYDSGFNNGVGLLKYSEIAKLMKKSPAKRKMIIVDSCNSGSSKMTSRGKQKHRSGDPNVVLFMSSRANESSLEYPNLGNSVFTKYLISGLSGKADANKDRRVSAKEIFDYVSNNVRRISSGKQHPVMWGNFDQNFIITTY
ncbi:MAG: caspase family protein [Muribaculaceae bacterium]|nr:caspase family protein [Muribaculaceae bacterium]